MTEPQPVKIEVLLKMLSYSIAFTALASVFMHIGYLYQALTVGLALFSIYTDFKSRKHLQKSVINLLSVLVILISFYRLNIDDPATPLIEGLSLLLLVKFIEEKSFRDYMQIYAISLFLLAGSALFNVDISFLIYFFILLFLLAVSIVILTFYTEDRGLILGGMAVLKTLGTALLIPLISIPMMGLLFAVLPRTNYPLFSFLNRPDKGLTGFTDNIRLGDVSDIQADNSVIFRASMRPIGDNMLYWRGTTLDYFDGAAWSKSSKAINDRVDVSLLKGNREAQNIFLEAYNNNYLFALDRPYFVSLQGARILSDLTLSIDAPVMRRIRYEVYSIASASLRMLHIDLKRYLQLPDAMPETVKALALSLHSKSDDRVTVENIIRHLNSQGFRYSLEGLPITDNPIEDFLFKYRYGNCEYYASAAAVMLRTAGIPARLVVGYRGGIYNPFGAYYMITQQTAHVWVEVFIGDSWVRIDPTPGSYITGPTKRPLLLTLTLYADTINYYWNQMVINYNLERQIKGAMAIQGFFKGLRVPDIKAMKEIALKSIIILGSVVSVILILYWLSRRRDLEQRLVAAFERRLKKAGYTRAPNQGLREFAETIRDPLLKDRAMLFVQEIEMLYYKDKKIGRKEEEKLWQRVKSL